MGWKWVLYWPAIGCGFGFLILFFLMEETNYDRKTIGVVESIESSANSTYDSANDPEKGTEIPEPTTTSIEAGPVHNKKTFLQKLSLLDKTRPNQLLTMMWRPFTFVSLPVVVYSGRCWGSPFFSSSYSRMSSSLPETFLAKPLLTPRSLQVSPTAALLYGLSLQVEHLRSFSRPLHTTLKLR